MWTYQGAFVIFLIIFIIFVPIPRIASLFLIWLVLVIICKILSGCWFFSIFIATTFIAILFVFLLMKYKKENAYKSDNFGESFVESFAEKEETLKEEKKEVETKVEEKKVEEKKEDLPKEENKEEKKVEIIMEEKKVPMSVDEVIKSEVLDKPNPIEIKATPKSLPLGGGEKISMMDKDSMSDDDFFGKLDTGEFEDSDEDSSDDEAALEKKVGKTSVSSKKAYKAQKQLYDLSTAVNSLHDNMNKLAPSLKKGQKIIESINKLGINFT